MIVTIMEFAPPAFYCPIPPAIHPAAEELERRAVAWIDDMGMHRTARERARLVRSSSVEFYARFAPEGIAENVFVAALWVYWGFAFDDARCDLGPLSGDPAAFLPMAGAVQRVLEGSARPADPYASALHDIVTRMRGCATPTQVRRFANAHRHWLYCVAWQVANKSTDRMPNLDEYLTMRIGSAGGPPTIALLEIANGREVPAGEMDSPAVRALTDMVHLIAALDNDVYSHHTEMAQAHTEQNVINVLVHHEGQTTEEATDRAVALRDRVMTRFLELRERVMPSASEELRVYLTGLGHAIRGNLDWAATVGRYDGPTVPEVTDTPRDASPEPLPFPGLAWWWDDLTP